MARRTVPTAKVAHGQSWPEEPSPWPYTFNPQLSSYSRTVSILVEANLLVREGNLEFLTLLLSAVEANEGGYFKMPEYNDFNMADIYYYRCPVNRAAKLFGKAPEQYERMTVSYRGLISKNPGYAPLGIGEYLYENNRLEDALPYLLKALEEAREADCMGAFVPAMVDLSRINRARGDMQGAFEALEECENKLQSSGKAHWIYLIHAFRCRLYMDVGDMAKVEEWLESCKLNVFTEINRIREFELIVYARLLMAKGCLQEASLLLQRLLSFTGDNARLHSRVEVLNLLASLASKNNNMYAAVNYLGKSLMIGMKEGYIRSYIDELPDMAHLLRYYTIPRRKKIGQDTTKAMTAYAKSLLKLAHENLPAVLDAYGGATAAEMKEYLTVQEKIVLELLVKANTNQEIAGKLSISPRTVKSHIGSIYSKLGVKNRAQCMKLVQETGLLE